MNISVSIITHNRKELLKRVVVSLEAQTFPRDKFEVIVVDDGSTDGTPGVMKEVVAGSPVKIRYFRQDENRGKSEVRNISLKEAQGDIVLFLEDDTVADPGLLEEHAGMHERYPSRGTAVLGREAMDMDSVKTPFGRYVAEMSNDFFGRIHDSITAGKQDAYLGFITFNLSVKRDFLLKEGMFDPEFRYFCEDIELGYRLFSKGLELRYNADAIVYNFHPPYFDEYCRRNLNRGYFNEMLAEKHPEAFAVASGGREGAYFLKDAVYPFAMRAIDFSDKCFKLPFPRSAYRKVLEYYTEKGSRSRLRASGQAGR